LTTLKIDIVSDVVCPWCYVGKARLERALSAMKGVEAEITWRPYQLAPTIPPAGMDRKAYIEAKVGSGPRVDEIHRQLVSFGKEVGIDFQFEKIKLTPNTMNAHRLIRWAAQAGPGIQNKIVDRLFHLYFTQGADLGDSAILIKAGKESGMDASIIETLMPTDAEVAGVTGEIEASRKIGVTGVPFFIFNQKYGVSGAQTPEVLIEAMQSAMSDTNTA
jgi:predicted DsbA family dithiol-disulfide isomerase